MSLWTLGRRGPGDILRVEVSRKCNVRLMSSEHALAYRYGRAYDFYGGQLAGPGWTRMGFPRLADWTLAIDTQGLGKYSLTAKVSVFDKPPKVQAFPPVAVDGVHVELVLDERTWKRLQASALGRGLTPWQLGGILLTEVVGI